MGEEKFIDLIRDLKQASDDCWSAKVLLQELSNKYAPLCIKIMLEGRQIPKLINNRIENRKLETGLEPIHPDFWSADMIIALFEHFESCLEKENACA